MAKDSTVNVRPLVEALRATLKPLGVTGDLVSIEVVRGLNRHETLRVKTTDGSHRHEYNFDVIND